MDVVTIDKSEDRLRILYDSKGRFYCKSLSEEESKVKLLKVVKKAIGPN
jgi:small subunit ribosomal protein S4e